MECTINISEESIRGLLCSALEGGVNYWCRLEGYDFTESLSIKDFRIGGTYYEDLWHPSQLIPFVPGCGVKLLDILDKNKKYTLNKDAISKGLRVMAFKYPKHFGDFLSKYYDAITGDVFLQCCLFGEIVYG